jgi:hypothetical protein
MSDHIGDVTKMVCVHCGMPSTRQQNGIQGYRCGSSYEPNFRPQWARSMTCLELQNGQLQERINLLEAANSDVARIAAERDRANERIKWLEDIIKRAGYKFFEDGTDGRIAVNMLTILDEAREAKP